VKIPLVGDLTDHSCFLEKVVVDIRTHWLALSIEVDLKVFAKSRRVVVSQGLCVSKRLKQRICSQHHVLDLLNRGVAST
jgi:hypothetical protein